MLKPSHMSEVLTEIQKIDPNFTQEKFIKFCRHVFIPNLLEASGSSSYNILTVFSY